MRIEDFLPWVFFGFGCFLTFIGFARAAPPPEEAPPISPPEEVAPVEHKFPDDMIVQNLNYGWIGYSPSMAEEMCGPFYLYYSAPGIAASLYSIVVGQPIIYGMYSDRILSFVYELEAYANEQINGYQYYIDKINQGYCIGVCVNGTVFVYESCDRVVEACELWQGGFSRFLNDPAYWESRKQPYYKMLDDADIIRIFIDKYTT